MSRIDKLTAQLINLRFRKHLHFSQNEIAIKGKSEYLFLYKGFNRYYQMYFDPDEAIRIVTEKWIASIALWEDSVKARNSQFIFLIVPNKATLLQSFYPLSLPKQGTAYLVSLTKNCKSAVFWPKNKSDIFRRNDTHLSPKGNFEFASFILEQTGLDDCFAHLVDAGSAEVVGDLGSKFDPPISEIVKFYSLAGDFSRPQIDFDNSSEYLPTRHVGISIRLSNPKAPVKKTLRVFGNSFLGVAAENSTLWLLGTIFQNVAFEWSPKVNLDVIGENEIVIFQTCERFLGYSPDHWG